MSGQMMVIARMPASAGVTACRDGAMMYGVTEKRKGKKTAKKR